MKHSAVLFDLYGTLADVEVDEKDSNSWSILRGLLGGNSSALSPTDLRSRFETLCDQEVRVHGEGFALACVFRRLLVESGWAGSEQEVADFAQRFRETTIKHLDVRPYSIALLTALQRSGARLALVSNSEALVTHYDISKLGIEKYFDKIIISSEVGVKKPSPEIFNYALHELQVGVDNAAFVGDTWETDVEGPLRIGLKAIYLDPELAPMTFVRCEQTERLLRAHPDAEAIQSAIKVLLCN